MKPRIRFQDRLMLIALAGGLPAIVIACAMIYAYAPAPVGAVAIAALLACWIGFAAFLRRRVVAPLQTLANLLEAVRYGDYSIRGRRARRDDSLGEVILEVNALGSALQTQRLAAAEAGALMQSVLEELDAAVFTFDGNARLRLVNRAGASLLGRTPGAVLGLHAADLGIAFLFEPDDASVRTLAFPARTGRFEVQQRSFRESGIPHRLFMVSDLTRTLREEERRAWQRLIRVLGHEINNSLTPIKSLARSLHDMLREDPRRDVPDSLDLIADRADSLTKFVATYSQLARLPPPVRSRVSLNALLERLAALPLFEHCRVIAPANVDIEADAGQLEQVLINLVKNAVEAMQSSVAGGGGTGAVEIELKRVRDGVRIDVRDEGPGLANPDNLFVPFFTTKPGGSGVGLMLSRQMIEAHGGTLVLQNREDRSGCLARITLPTG